MNICKRRRRPNHVCAMTHSYVCHDSFTCETLHDILVQLYQDTRRLMRCSPSASLSDEVGCLPPKNKQTEDAAAAELLHWLFWKNKTGVHRNGLARRHGMYLVTLCDCAGLICEWVMAHIRMSHGTHVIGTSTSLTYIHASLHCVWSCRSHIWMSHGAHTKESWHTYEWDMARTRLRRPSHIHSLCILSVNQS